jgi:hypothetical protein
MGMGMGVHPMPSPTGDDFADESIDPSRLAGCLSLSSVLFSLYLIALLATFFG